MKQSVGANGPSMGKTDLRHPTKLIEREINPMPGKS